MRKNRGYTGIHGSGFYTALSKDLKELIPGVKGFASSNLRYMAKFYSLYTPLIFPQVVGDLSEEADDLIRREEDNKTIGLIICKSKNNVLAKYAVGTSNEPIGISEFELSNLLPTTDEIEKELRGNLAESEGSQE